MRTKFSLFGSFHPRWQLQYTVLATLVLTACLATSRAVSADGLITHTETGHHIHGSHPECPLPKTAQDVVRCASENHPNVLRVKFDVDHSKNLSAVAAQIPNPELDVEALPAGRSIESETQIGILMPIEWGGKRSARIKAASAEARQSQASLTQRKARAIIDTVIQLHRLRQVRKEINVLNDSIETLSRVINQQRSRPALAPEQRVSLSVFRMALADAKLRQSELFDEERGIEHYFHITTGHSLTEIASVLPEAPEAWPSVDDQPSRGAPSPVLQESMAFRDLALAELNSAQAASWPSLRVGPLLGIQGTEGGNSTVFGVRLMMDLPVFNRNAAGRDYATSGVSRADRLTELMKAEESHERAEQVRVYQRAINALESAPDLSDVERESVRSESLARNGLVSASLLLESQRQRSDLIESLHSRELRAISALWEIHRFDGRIFEESLK